MTTTKREIIGHTTSGKPVYGPAPDHATKLYRTKSGKAQVRLASKHVTATSTGYTKRDHEDARAIHFDAAARITGKPIGEPSDHLVHVTIAHAHRVAGNLVEE